MRCGATCPTAWPSSALPWSWAPAFRAAIELAPERRDAAALPPVAQHALERRLVAHALHRALGVDLGERRRHGGDITAMTVEEIEAREAVAGERHHLVADQRDQRRRPHRHRAGKIEMVLRHADRDGRSYQRADLLADTAADHLGGQRIGADQPGRAVLL